MARADETYTWGATRAASLMSSQGYLDFSTTGLGGIIGAEGAISHLRVYSDGRVKHIGYDAAPLAYGTISSLTSERFVVRTDGSGILDDLKYYIFANWASYPRGSFRIGCDSDAMPGFRTPPS